MVPANNPTPTPVLDPSVPWIEPTPQVLPTLEPVKPGKIIASSPLIICADDTSKDNPNIVVLEFVVDSNGVGYYSPTFLPFPPDVFSLNPDGSLSPSGEQAGNFVGTGLEETYNLNGIPDHPDQTLHFEDCLVKMEQLPSLHEFFEIFPGFLHPIPFQEGI